jgi:hypothetical protein
MADAPLTEEELRVVARRMAERAIRRQRRGPFDTRTDAEIALDAEAQERVSEAMSGLVGDVVRAECNPNKPFPVLDPPKPAQQLDQGEWYGVLPDQRQKERAEKLNKLKGQG